ncbi:hypothetical protein V9T40_007655 [Parthenolecanium corni]|uniref:Uncharacterized protein n=1 Tax=Parthenolecanium corni TaxID=536013 RepID=A0AAN9TI19_9HEMI
MAVYLIFYYFVLVPLCCASVVRNGIKLVALPIPGTIYKNGSIVVNTRSEQHDVGDDQVQNSFTVTVKTPAATLTFSNASQHEKSIVEQVRSSLEDNVSALGHLDPSELIDLDVPVHVNDLLELAKSSSPAKFREKIYGSQMMEKLIDTLQQKSVELYNLKTELEDGSHKVVKRAAVWDTPDLPNSGVQFWPLPQYVPCPVMVPIPQTITFGRSSEAKARLPIHHPPHLLHRLHRVHLPPRVPHLPHLHLTSLMPLLRSEALPILKFPRALLNFIFARPVRPAIPPTHTHNPMPQPMGAEIERPHWGRPQLQPAYHSLAYYHGQEPDAQPLPPTLPEVNSQMSQQYYEGSLEQQADAEIDQILTRAHRNTDIGNYKPISPWEGIFFSLFRDFSLT